MRVSILIPAYQEERTIAEVLRRVLACDVRGEGFDREVLVCDDGSSDGTGDIVAAVARTTDEVSVYTHPHNRGKDAAVRTRLEHATGDCALVQDADLEYEVEDCRALLRRFRAGADAVYGSRFLATRRPRGMRTANLIANRVLTATANFLYGHALTDEATCSKLVRTSLLRAMHLECEGFELCPEITAKLGNLGVAIEEVPVRYSARDVAGGKKVRWRDGVKAMAVLVEHRIVRAK